MLEGAKPCIFSEIFLLEKILSAVPQALSRCKLEKPGLISADFFAGRGAEREIETKTGSAPDHPPADRRPEISSLVAPAPGESVAAHANPNRVTEIAA